MRENNDGRKAPGIARSTVLTLVLAALAVTGCSTTTPAMLAQEAETVSIESAQAPKTNLKSQTRGGAAVQTAGKGAGIGLAAGGTAGYVVGVGTSFACGPLFAVCAPVLIPAGAVAGALGGVVVGAVGGGVAGGLAGSGISPEDAEALDAVFADLEASRDFSAEFLAEVGKGVARQRKLVVDDADLKLAIDLLGVRLSDREEDAVALEMDARMLIIYVQTSGRERTLVRHYRYESNSIPAPRLLQDDGALAASEIDDGIARLARDILTDLGL